MVEKKSKFWEKRVLYKMWDVPINASGVFCQMSSHKTEFPLKDKDRLHFYNNESQVRIRVSGIL